MLKRINLAISITKINRVFNLMHSGMHKEAIYLIERSKFTGYTNPISLILHANCLIALNKFEDARSLLCYAAKKELEKPALEQKDDHQYYLRYANLMAYICKMKVDPNFGYDWKGETNIIRRLDVSPKIRQALVLPS